MRQAVLTSPGVIEYRNVPAPGTLRENEVLLRVKKIGVCGSDIHMYHGKHPSGIFPVVQGHEYSALVEAVGEKVTKVIPGMKATARPQLVCGTCASCRRGLYNICENLKVEGFHTPGVAQDLFVVSEDRLIALPDTMSLDHGAMIEPVSVAAHATACTASLKGKNVVVTGAGTIGNLVAQFAKSRGAGKVLITDVSDYRLNIAKECGIDEVVNVGNYSFEEKADIFFGEEGFQVGFEAAGVQPALDVLVKNIEKGGEIIVVGVYAENPVVSMLYLGEHELKMIGTLMYLHEDYLEALEAVVSGRINLDPLITNHFPFEKYAEAYQFVDKQKDKLMKVIIDM
ncbi:MAG: zinc-binding dehydrogenase [Mangrovibacterium sp.]